MKKLIFILIIFIHIAFSQNETWNCQWYSNPTIDSVLYYELYIIENIDSLFLIQFKIDTSNYNQYWKSNYQNEETEIITGKFQIIANGDYMCAYLRAYNNYGYSLFSERSNIVKKGKKLSPNKTCIPFLFK